MRSIAYCLIVVFGILNVCLNLAFAQTTPTPTPQAPTVVTGEANYDYSNSSVTLTGTVNAHGLTTTAWFEYGTTSSIYNYVTSTQTVSESTDTSVDINLSMTDLPIRTGSPYTFFYRITAQNSVGISYGNEKSFKTLIHMDCPGCYVTGSVIDATTGQGIKKAIIRNESWVVFTEADGSYSWDDPEDYSVCWEVVYTLTASAEGYLSQAKSTSSSETACSEELNFELQPVSATSTPITDLTPPPTATPSPQAPIVTTGEAATNDELYSLTLNGTVNASGLLTTTWFEYGANSGSYTNTSSTQTVDGTNDTAVGIKISASEGTPYYYRIVAQNSAGTSYGNEMYIIVVMDTWWWEATKSMEVSPATLILKKKQSKDVTVTLTWGYGSLVGGENIETEITTGKRRISILPKSVVTDENGEAKFAITARRSGKAKITFRAKRGQYSGTLETTCIVRIRR